VRFDGRRFVLRIGKIYDWRDCATISFLGKGVNVGFGDEFGVGFGIVQRLAPFEPFVQVIGVGVDSRTFLVFMAPNRQPFGLLPALDGASFAAQMAGNLFSFQETSFLPVRGEPSAGGLAPLAGFSELDIEAIQCADYTLETFQCLEHAVGITFPHNPVPIGDS
jgi:hypothetical protein